MHMPYGSTYTCVQLLLLGRWRVIWVQQIGQLAKCRGYLANGLSGDARGPFADERHQPHRAGGQNYPRIGSQAQKSSKDLTTKASDLSTEVTVLSVSSRGQRNRQYPRRPVVLMVRWPGEQAARRRTIDRARLRRPGAAAPLNRIVMLTDYVAADERIVAARTRTWCMGASSLDMRLSF
jgi:hypothetical protein